MRYGYARVSTSQQNLDLQIIGIQGFDSSISESNENLFIEKISGKKAVDEREEYRILRRVLRPGDELVIDALDRLGRTKQIVKDEVEYFKKKGVTLRVLSLPTTLTDLGENAWVMEMVNNIIIEVYSSLAEEELAIKERRQRDGIEAAKLRGVYKGRKPKQIDWASFEGLYARWKAGGLKTKEFKQLLGLTTSTFYRVIKEYEGETPDELKGSKRSLKTLNNVEQYPSIRGMFRVVTTPNFDKEYLSQRAYRLKMKSRSEFFDSLKSLSAFQYVEFA